MSRVVGRTFVVVSPRSEGARIGSGPLAHNALVAFARRLGRLPASLGARPLTLDPIVLAALTWPRTSTSWGLVVAPCVVFRPVVRPSEMCSPTFTFFHAHPAPLLPRVQDHWN